MKRLTLLCLMVLFSPVCAFALLIPMTETEMKAAFARAGIQVEILYLEVIETLDELEYKDENGTDGITAYVKVRSRDHHKIYRAVYTEDDFVTLFSSLSDGMEPSASWNEMAYLTINVGTCETLTAIDADQVHLENGTLDPPEEPVTGVILGLPTVVVHTVIDDYSIGVNRQGALNDGANYLRITQKNSVTAILGGSLEIAAH